MYFYVFLNNSYHKFYLYYRLMAWNTLGFTTGCHLICERCLSKRHKKHLHPSVYEECRRLYNESILVNNLSSCYELLSSSIYVLLHPPCKFRLRNVGLSGSPWECILVYIRLSIINTLGKISLPDYLRLSIYINNDMIQLCNLKLCIS